MRSCAGQPAEAACAERRRERVDPLAQTRHLLANGRAPSHSREAPGRRWRWPEPPPPPGRIKIRLEARLNGHNVLTQLGQLVAAEQDAAGQALLDDHQPAGRRRHRRQVARRLLSPADPLPQQRELRLKEAVALLEEAVALLDLA
eukprot:scaffold25445_cov56-Phaeocystis_antarctica.AAC.2